MNQRDMDMNGLHPGTLVAGRYQIVRRIGAGGMGVVYEAIDTLLERRTVALKCIAPHAAESGSHLARFRREVMLAQRVTHPNVCRVHDLVEAGGRYYLSMQLIAGETLAERLAAQPACRLSPETALPLLLQALDGVAAIHAAGIVHRDLKPANIMITTGGHVVVMDFGLALAQDLERLSATDAVLGTLPFMAPEQVLSQALDTRTDVYALGIILYCVLTGRPPFKGDTHAIMHAQAYLAPPDPRHFVPSLDARLAAIILYCLNKRPDDRFASVDELRAALEVTVTIPRETAPRPMVPAGDAQQPAARPVHGNAQTIGNVQASGSGNIQTIGNVQVTGTGNVQTIGNVQVSGTGNVQTIGNAGPVTVTNVHHHRGRLGGVLALGAVGAISLLLYLPPRPNPTPSPTPVPSPSPSPSPSVKPPRPAPTLTPQASVFVTCSGAADICTELTPALVTDLKEKGIGSVALAGSAHARVRLQATLTGAREEMVGDAAFTISRYAIQAEATLARTGTLLALPGAVVQADTTVAEDALIERTRAVALSISDALEAALKP